MEGVFRELIQYGTLSITDPQTVSGIFLVAQNSWGKLGANRGQFHQKPNEHFPRVSTCDPRFFPRFFPGFCFCQSKTKIRERGWGRVLTELPVLDAAAFLQMGKRILNVETLKNERLKARILLSGARAECSRLPVDGETNSKY